MKQLLCLSHQPWQARPNRTQQLMARLSDANIIYFEPPTPQGVAKQPQGRNIRSHIIIYTLPAAFPAGTIRTFSQRRALRQNLSFIRSVMEKHHFHTPVLWCTSPIYCNAIGKIPCHGIIYDCHREWSDEFLDQESDLTSRADVVFAASLGLVNRLSPCSDNIVLLPNGVSPTMFNRDDFSPPSNLTYLRGKTVLGRAGDLTGQTDLSPILSAASTQPDWFFLLIGRFTPQVSAQLRVYPNIILTGPVNVMELPDYFSLCSILFDLTNSTMRGCDILPIRIYEYLATGKPIVMMAHPEYDEPYPDVIYTAYDSVGFLRRCHKAIAECSDELSHLRKGYAAQSSWSKKATEIESILNATGLWG